MRIGGLASGMDIDTIVEKLMVAERIPLDKLEQQKQILEWQQEDYRSLNSSLFSFRSTTFNMKLEATFNTKIATSSDEDVVTVTAGTSALEGTYSIVVNNLAAGVTKGSSTELANERDDKGNILTLYEQFSEFAARGYLETDTISVTINGTELKFDLDEDNINTVVSAINGADLGVTASYDTTYNRFFLTTTETGSAAEITITADEANFISSNAEASILKLKINENTTYNGQNASIDIGNDVTGIESSTNNISINGLNLSLTDTGSATVVVSRDIDSIVSTITNFVTAYNSTIEDLYNKVHEERNLEYPPLTDAQKEDMSDDEIELWEEQARSGLLRNDIYLNNIISNMRRATSRVVEGVEGDYSSLSSIGITTLRWDDNGQLYINESQLREALSKDFEGVKELFTNSSETDNEKGIASYLYDVVDNSIDYLSDKAGTQTSFSVVDNSYIGKKLKTLSQEIEDWEERLEDIENRYWRQFTNMEIAINQMNAQSAWLSQQFSG